MHRQRLGSSREVRQYTKKVRELEGAAKGQTRGVGSCGGSNGWRIKQQVDHVEIEEEWI